jgi:hypothetical protein
VAHPAGKPLNRGAGLLLINPKGWAMAFGAAASFSILASGPLQLALLLGSALGFGAAVSLSLWFGAGLLLAASILPMWLD